MVGLARDGVARPDGRTVFIPFFTFCPVVGQSGGPHRRWEISRPSDGQRGTSTTHYENGQRALQEVLKISWDGNRKAGGDSDSRYRSRAGCTEIARQGIGDVSATDGTDGTDEENRFPSVESVPPMAHKSGPGWIGGGVGPEVETRRLATPFE